MVGRNVSSARTQIDESSGTTEAEGGKILFMKLFGKEEFEKIFYHDLCFLLNLKNWESDTLTFQKNYMKCKNNLSNENLVLNFDIPKSKDVLENTHIQLVGKLEGVVSLGQCLRYNH